MTLRINAHFGVLLVLFFSSVLCRAQEHSGVHVCVTFHENYPSHTVRSGVTDSIVESLKTSNIDSGSASIDPVPVASAPSSQMMLSQAQQMNCKVLLVISSLNLIILQGFCVNAGYRNYGQDPDSGALNWPDKLRVVVESGLNGTQTKLGPVKPVNCLYKVGLAYAPLELSIGHQPVLVTLSNASGKTLKEGYVSAGVSNRQLNSRDIQSLADAVEKWVQHALAKDPSWNGSVTLAIGADLFYSLTDIGSGASFGGSYVWSRPQEDSPQRALDVAVQKIAGEIRTHAEPQRAGQ